MKKSTVIPILGLISLTVLVFAQVVGFEFLNFDDDFYVSRNLDLQLGFTWQGLKWAFTYTGTGNWHPMTWLSLMLDYQLFGLNPAAFHFINLVFHGLNGLLLFVLLKKMTGSTWRSFFVAAFFLIHPLRVESVAWVAERKDVLSGFFFILMLLTYSRYTDSYGQGRGHSAWYWLAFIFFLLGLLSKEMLVTAPFVLLLLDYWPLRRYQNFSEFKKCSKEKFIFFVLMIVMCFAAYASRVDKGLHMNEEISFIVRTLNAFYFYGMYLLKTFWPTQLSFFYPYPIEGVGGLKIVSNAVILFVLTGFVFFKRRSFPFLWIGWLWFMGMLVPVIGIVKIGSSAFSDRYTYLPHIGFFLALVWTVWQIIAYKSELIKKACIGLGLLLIVICLALSWKQTSYWSHNENLYEHALSIEPKNFLAHMNLGVDLKKRKQFRKALYHFEQAKAHRSGDAEPVFMIGSVYYEMGDRHKAMIYLKVAAQMDPQKAETYEILGEIYTDQGKPVEAIEYYQKVLGAGKDEAAIHYNLGNLWLSQKNYEEAEKAYLNALQRDEAHIKTYNNLGNLYILNKEYKKSESSFLNALQIDPRHSSTLLNIAILYALQGDEARARASWRRFRQIYPDMPLSEQKRAILSKVINFKE